MTQLRHPFWGEPHQSSAILSLTLSPGRSCSCFISSSSSLSLSLSLILSTRYYAILSIGAPGMKNSVSLSVCLASLYYYYHLLDWTQSFVLS